MGTADSVVHEVSPQPDGDLLAALAGRQAGRDGAVAHRTRRVVLTSLGQLQEMKASRKRSRAVALAVLLLVILAMGPFVWRVVDDLIGGEHFIDLATQFSLLICIFCPAVVAAVVVAGWVHRDS